MHVHLKNYGVKTLCRRSLSSAELSRRHYENIKTSKNFLAAVNGPEWAGTLCQLNNESANKSSHVDNNGVQLALSRASLEAVPKVVWAAERERTGEILDHYMPCASARPTHREREPRVGELLIGLASVQPGHGCPCCEGAACAVI